jgi:RluA family pseudouridine synthase
VSRILRHTVTSDGGTLVQTVAALLRGAFPALEVSNADARRAVMAGAVRVNARPLARPAAVLRAGDRVSVAADPARLSRVRRGRAAVVEVLYEDQDVIVADKPAGLPTHATADPKRPHLVGQLAGQLGVGESALGVHQRLDAATSGLVLFGRTSQANAGLARVFADRLVEKEYLAVVDARQHDELRVGDAWTSADRLAPGGRGRRGRRVEISSGGHAAQTSFTVLARDRSRLLLDARPRTGRLHQIRAHLAAAGLPIVGDVRYGGPPAPRLLLHAWRLTLPHPVSGRRLRVESRPPSGFLVGGGAPPT